jgi:16S rRNA (adenine1518-N6/adenine1519-N6)-dimethyltransferase
VRGDVLGVTWEALLGGAERGAWICVANLPYAITGPAIIRLLDAHEWFAQLVVMVQQEVAERLLAPAGDRTRGIPTVLAEATCDLRVVGQVPRTCFWPRPRVDSTVLALAVRRPQPVPERMRPTFLRVVKAAFGTRRKTLTNALAHSPDLSLSKEEARAVLSDAGIDGGLRAEGLDVDAFRRLTEAVAGREGCDVR